MNKYGGDNDADEEVVNLEVNSTGNMNNSNA